MKAIMVMFDSLNRHMLPPYGNDWVHAPNFQRLAARTVTFDNSYIGSMPCMPARRELHTGRYNFLHRSWGPIEPFDDSMPAILKQNDVYTHLVTDHVHYFADGGSTYHSRYSSWEFNRGQEGDNWKGIIDPDFEIPPVTRNMESNQPARMWIQDWINRRYMPSPEEQSQTLTFNQGIEFIQHNADADNWFLQIETFDPHEPFFTHEAYKAHYPHEYDGPFLDWPTYGPVSESPQTVEHLRYQYASLLSMCDASLGRVLDLMNELNLWDDTMLIVCTDHGFLLGEHDWWGKNLPPWYNEIARIPLFIWDPRSGLRDDRRQSLVQMIDLPATLLEFFNIERPPDMQGVPLRETILNDTPVREAALFGTFGTHVNVTNGQYVYMRAPEGEAQSLYEYTLMPMHIRWLFTPEEIKKSQLVEPFAFTKECPVLKIPGKPWGSSEGYGTLLFDLDRDPGQSTPIEDAEVERMMVDHLLRLMVQTDAPSEQFERLGLLEQRQQLTEHQNR